MLRELAELTGVHDEDDVRPLQHPLIHLDERFVTGAGGEDLERRIPAEHAFRGRAPLLVELADEQRAHQILRRRPHGRVILAA